MWVVPGVRENKVVNFPDIFPYVEPTFSKALKLVAFFGIDVTTLAA